MNSSDLANQNSTGCPVRGIYFATHFGNWYENAPVAEVCTYIQELAARGSNHLMLWFDLSNYYGLESPEAQKLLARLRRYAATARGAGMRVGLVRVANEAWRDSPPELRADPNQGRGAIMLSDLCASQPQSHRLMADISQQVFGLFEHLDFLCLWPYDSGGCACAGCQPWGSNGFLVAGEILAREFRQHFPDGQVILSTWMMDESEWPVVREAIKSHRLPWVDALLAEVFHRGYYPQDLRDGDVPAGLPLLGFPEISMAGMEPWGGCGANPRPRAIEERWRALGRHIAGGFPYSEGIFEDVNKAIYAALYREPHRAVDDILREYVAREFSPEVAGEGAEMLLLMETTLQRRGLAAANLEAAPRIEQLASYIEPRLRPEVATGWRWRVLRLRARIDALLQSHAGDVTPELQAAFAELHALYHTDETSLLGWLLPPLPPQRTAPDSRNLAAHRPVTVSSSHPDWPGCEAALVDEVVAAFDPANFWSSAPDDAAPWVEIDLGEEHQITDVRVQFSAVVGKNNWYYYHGVPAYVTVEVAGENGTFTPVMWESHDVPVEGQLYKQWFYRYPVGRRARIIKLSFARQATAAHAGCVRISELRVY